MKILVTGSTGFLGNIIVNELISKYEIITLGRQNNTNLISPHVSIEADLSQKLDIKRLPKKIDIVIHLAQSREYKNFPRTALDIFNINTASTVELLNYALEAQAKQFVFASSGTVYTPYTNSLVEDLPLEPAGFYQASKLAAEQFISSYQESLKVCILRLFFPYGKGQKDRLISTLIDRISHGTPVVLEGTEEGLKFTPTYAQDIAKIVDCAISNEWTGKYNVSSSEIATIRSISTQIGILLGKEPIFTRNEKHGPVEIIPNLTRLNSIYPQTQFTSLANGLRETLL